MFHLKILPRWRFDLWWCADYPAYYRCLNAVPGGTLRNAVAKRLLAAQLQRWLSKGWSGWTWVMNGLRFVMHQLNWLCLHDHGSYLCLSAFITEVPLGCFHIEWVGAVFKILIHLDIPLNFTCVNQAHLGNTNQRYSQHRQTTHPWVWRTYTNCKLMSQLQKMVRGL